MGSAMLMFSVSFLAPNGLDYLCKSIFISQCLEFEFQEHISEALGLCRGYGHGSRLFFWMKEEEIGRHPANWFVHSYLKDKHYDSAGRLLKGTSFQTSSSQQSSGTSF